MWVLAGWTQIRIMRPHVATSGAVPELLLVASHKLGNEVKVGVENSIINIYPKNINFPLFMLHHAPAAKWICVSIFFAYNTLREIREKLFCKAVCTCFFFVCVLFLLKRLRAKIRKNFYSLNGLSTIFFKRHAKGIGTHEEFQKNAFFLTNPETELKKKILLELLGIFRSLPPPKIPPLRDSRDPQLMYTCAIWVLNSVGICLAFPCFSHTPNFDSYPLVLYAFILKTSLP